MGPHGGTLRRGNYSSAAFSPLLGYGLVAYGLERQTAALQDMSQPSEALRIRNQRQYFRLGRDYLERGIKNNPESFFLYRSLAVLLRDKFEDHCGAGEAFLRPLSSLVLRPIWGASLVMNWRSARAVSKTAYDLEALYDAGT